MDDAVATQRSHQQLRFFYQPVVDRATRATVCVDAVVQWDRANADPVPYRDVFDESASIDDVLEQTAFVLGQILSDLPQLKRMFGPDCAVGVALSATELRDSVRLLPVVLNALDSKEVQRSDLFIGVKLDPTVPAEPSMIQTLEALRAEHIRVVLDEDGAGIFQDRYGQVFFDYIRIGKTAIQRMMAHAPTRGLVAAIAAFAENVDIAVVADGVDDAMILNELESLTCPYVQGALFGDPVEIHELRPRVYRPRSAPAGSSNSHVDQMEVNAERVTRLRRRVDDLDPRGFKLDFDEFLEKALAVKAELATLPSRSGRELACILGQHVTVAAVYGGEKIATLDWGLETSNLAEELGQFGVSAQMLALISTVPVSTESSRFVRVEALSRALQLRATTRIDPAESGMLDNSLAMALAHMGLTDRARVWWTNLVSEYEDLDSPGHTYAAVNLAEIHLAALEDPNYNGSDTARSTALRRIDRATARLARSCSVTPGLLEALQARLAMAEGDTQRAFRSFGPWFNQEPQGIVPIFIVGRARAVLARSIGDLDAFLSHTSVLVERAAPAEILRHHRTQIMLLHIDALTQNGRIEEALITQRALVDHEIELGKLRSSAMFDWMQIRADVDLKFAHYANVAPLPAAVPAEG